MQRLFLFFFEIYFYFLIEYNFRKYLSIKSGKPFARLRCVPVLFPLISVMVSQRKVPFFSKKNICLFAVVSRKRINLIGNDICGNFVVGKIDTDNARKILGNFQRNFLPIFLCKFHDKFLEIF